MMTLDNLSLCLSLHYRHSTVRGTQPSWDLLCLGWNSYQDLQSWRCLQLLLFHHLNKTDIRCQQGGFSWNGADQGFGWTEKQFYAWLQQSRWDHHYHKYKRLYIHISKNINQTLTLQTKAILIFGHLWAEEQAVDTTLICYHPIKLFWWTC